MRTMNIGVAGLGGYAIHVTDELLKAAGLNGASPRLTAACDPDLKTNAARASMLTGHGVTVVDDFDKMLTLPIDAVWLPLPIELHRPFMERALAAGKAVLVEKPAAGSVDDVDAMIAARDKAGLPVAVGFQNLFDPATWAVKRKLLAGAIGKPIKANVYACWPRGQFYYQRNKWAGRLKHNGTWVLDSPANNAMAHFLNLALFLLGPTDRESATPNAVEAELYRVNPIENYDTCTIRLTLPNGAPLLVAMTHACKTLVEASIEIECEGGTLRFDNGVGYALNAGGKTEMIGTDHDRLPDVIDGFAACLRGEKTAEYATLENARAHTVAINGASQAGRPVAIAAEFVKTAEGQGGLPMHYVPNIEEVLRVCATSGKLLNETAQVPWSSPARSMRLENYTHFSL